eukprot:jgi/Tetstr1/427120/TSEL_017323.t1
MDPKRDFWLPSAAALASEAKQFGISVATLKTLYKTRTPTHPHPSTSHQCSCFARPRKIAFHEREWEDGTGGAAAPTRSQPGRAARTNPRYPKHDGTRFLDLSSDED